MSGGERKNADEMLALALAAGGTAESAAKYAGVSVATVGRRLRDPSFRRRVEDVRAEMVSRAVAQLTATTGLAVETLRELLKAKSETVRLGAVRAVIELGSKLREQEDLAERIRSLEDRLGDQREVRPWSPTTTVRPI